MAEKGPQQEDQAAAQEKFKELQVELQGLVKKLQEIAQDPEASQEEKMKLAQRIMEILNEFRQVMPPEQFAENFGQLEQFVNQVLGGMEG